MESVSTGQFWINQMNLIQESENSSAIAFARVCVKARDDFAEIQNIALALEKGIDADSSAIFSIFIKRKMIQQFLRMLEEFILMSQVHNVRFLTEVHTAPHSCPACPLMLFRP